MMKMRLLLLDPFSNKSGVTVRYTVEIPGPVINLDSLPTERAESLVADTIPAIAYAHPEDISPFS